MIVNNAALILIDIQNDFCPGGALAVPEGDIVIKVANDIMSKFKVVIATQDWHPKNHQSFASQHPGSVPGCFIELNGYQQILWPDHCVAESFGSELHPVLDKENITKIFRKGTCVDIDSYSAFYDNHHLKSTGLTDWLRQLGITDLYFMGLATDYCVKYSCLDALADGFAVRLIEDGCKGINLLPDDVDNALTEMIKKGVIITSSKELLTD